MEIDQLKNLIGDKARETITSYYMIAESRGTFPCRLTAHAKGDQARMEWLSKNCFHCCDCNESFDIISHAKQNLNLEGSEFFGYLEELAGVITTEEVKRMPTTKEEPFTKDFSGLIEVKRICNGVDFDTIAYLGSRSITGDTIKVFGIDGDDKGMYFNYWSRTEDNKYTLCKIKGRVNRDEKNGRDKYLPISGGSNILYGAHMFRGHGALIITEGEIDCLSMYEGIKFVGAEDQVMAVSVPSGTSYKWIEQCQQFLDQFDSIIICADNDEAGIKFREEAFTKMRDRHSMKWIDLGLQKVNDVNDLLMSKGKEAVGSLLSRIEAPCHTHGLSADKIERNLHSGYIKFGFYGLDRALQGAKLGELTVLAGESNDGKSTIVRQIVSYNVRNGVGVGAVFGEETPERFMDESIRQCYIGREHRTLSGNTEWSDPVFEPSAATEALWKKEYGKNINLFQIDKVRDNDKIGDKIFEWMNHCAEIENKHLFIIDNLMKITIDEHCDELTAQAKFMERLYRFVQKKMVHVILVVHTKKIEGMIDQNSIHGSKKIYNTPDTVLFFQRADRFKTGEGQNRETMMDALKKDCNITDDFTSYIWAHKIRHRNPNYTKTRHLMEYDRQSTLSTELLSSDDFNEEDLYEDGHSRISISEKKDFHNAVIEDRK